MLYIRSVERESTLKKSYSTLNQTKEKYVGEIKIKYIKTLKYTDKFLIQFSFETESIFISETNTNSESQMIE